MAFHAELTNPKPPGLIQSDGWFGPWNAARPADSQLHGNYTLRDAINRCSRASPGTLSSAGSYNGQLGSLEVQGTTDVPDFTLTIGGRAMLLHYGFRGYRGWHQWQYSVASGSRETWGDRIRRERVD